MRRLRKTGADAARIHFGCRGMSVAHNVDVFGQAHHVDWLVPWKDYYVTNPSTSPENRFLTPKEHAVTGISMASTFDMELIRELFGNFRKACDLLGIDDKCLKDIDRIEPKLYPYHVGKYGQLQEWFEDFDEADPGNAHYSLLYGLYPGELLEDHPELKNACRVTLDRRVQHGGLVSETGWSGAWALSFYAIFGESEIVDERLRYFLQNSMFDNMWAKNFGGGD